MNTDIQRKGFCYVVLKADTFHPIASFRHAVAMYPEEKMSLLQTANYAHYERSIVTENPYLISAYPKSNVRLWDEVEGWVEPEVETFGMSVDAITHSILGIHITMATVALGGDFIEKKLVELTSRYMKAQSLPFHLVSSFKSTGHE